MSQQFQVRRQMCHIRSRFHEACAAVVRCVRLRSKSRQLHRILVLQRSVTNCGRTADQTAGNLMPAVNYQEDFWPETSDARHTTCGFLRRNTALKARAAAHSNLSRSGRRNLPKSLSLEDGQDSSFPFQRPRTRTGPLWFPGCQHGFASPSICPVRFEQPWLRAVVRLLFSNWVRL
ncbi:Hypothetical_protein [Hexamita inflata]|uniref:Hypothetical_protein n=1 Tax=Hexamita inflata TaxID=28002 RepID=A0AA86UE07_9EUKA|nr:Hypothetical protein HINF_LOCUS42090 [Hexamita inflata]